MTVAAPKQIASHVLEGVNYITLPAALSEISLPALRERVKQWSTLKVDMHVIDFKGAQVMANECLLELQAFADKTKAEGINLISVNMADPIFREVKKLSIETSFNRILNFPGDLQQKRKLSETETRRLLFRYLAKGAFAAVEVSLNSTVECDENYSARPEDVPLDQFDMISVITINTHFLEAEFRLCSSNSVMEKLAKAMMGPGTAVDAELMESMALELLNMVYGFAKSNLNDKEGFSLPTAIPRLMRKGDFHRIKRSPASNLTIMPMVTPMGSFYVEVDFGKQSAPKV